MLSLLKQRMEYTEALKEEARQEYNRNWKEWRKKLRSKPKPEASPHDPVPSEIPVQRYMSTLAVIPEMFHPNEVRPMFVNRNGFIENCKLEDVTFRQEHAWTAEEEQTFVKLFKKCGRDFYQLSQSFPDRNLKDCIKFYYANKKRLNLKCRPVGVNANAAKNWDTGAKDTVVCILL